jgi:hypothetical protein
MARRQNAVDAEIAGRLDTTPEPGSPNRIRVEKLREWAVEYLASTDEELAQFPELAGRPHWNLWMMDARYEDALFAVLIFRADGMEFFCGTGNAYKVKRFAERDFPDNPDEMLGMMKTIFSIPRGSIRLDRKAAEKWLGRSW